MARKPQVPSSPKPPEPRRPPAKTATAPARKAGGGEAGLRRELVAARAKIAELEAKQGEIAKRVEAAIAAIHKILDI